MTVQVLYKNKAKSSNSGVIALFAEDKFQIKNTGSFLSKNEISYTEKILKYILKVVCYISSNYYNFNGKVNI